MVIYVTETHAALIFSLCNLIWSVSLLLISYKTFISIYQDLFKVDAHEISTIQALWSFLQT